MYNLSSEIQNRKYIPNKFYINMKEILRKRLGWKNSLGLNTRYFYPEITKYEISEMFIK